MKTRKDSQEQEQADPRLLVECPACGSRPGVKCHNYKGQNKQTCPARGRPVPPRQTKAVREKQQGELFQ